jgi:hypothetical protein
LRAAIKESSRTRPPGFPPLIPKVNQRTDNLHESDVSLDWPAAIAANHSATKVTAGLGGAPDYGADFPAAEGVCFPRVFVIGGDDALTIPWHGQKST